MTPETRSFLAQVLGVPEENIVDFRAEDRYIEVKLYKPGDLDQVEIGIRTIFAECSPPSNHQRQLSQLFDVPVRCLTESKYAPGRVDVEIRIPRSEHGSWEEIAAVLSADPICDGCNVGSSFEHRCHGERSVIQGVQTNFKCCCPDCT